MRQSVTNCVPPVKQRPIGELCVNGSARRLQRLGLLALARKVLSGEQPAGRVVPSLHCQLQHGGAERAVLSLAASRERPRLDAAGARQLSLFNQGQPDHHARETARAHAHAGGGILQVQRNTWREARLFSFSISAELSLYAVAAAHHYDANRSELSLRD